MGGTFGKEESVRESVCFFLSGSMWNNLKESQNCHSIRDKTVILTEQEE